jgi:hypothetical protein
LQRLIDARHHQAGRFFEQLECVVELDPFSVMLVMVTTLAPALITVTDLAVFVVKPKQACGNFLGAVPGCGEGEAGRGMCHASHQQPQ